MKESKFSIVSKNPRVTIIGGLTWKAPKPAGNEEGSVKFSGKTLCIAIRSDDTIEVIIKQIQKLTRKTSFGLYFKLIVTYLLEPVLLILPAVFMVLLIGLLGAYGNLINELISLGNDSTQIVADKNQMFIVYTTFFILIAYLFPFIFQGDFVKTFSDAKKFLDTNERHRNRTLKILQLLSRKSKFVDKVELWDPGLLKEGQDWVGKTLIPGIIAAKLPTDMYIHVGEKFVTRKLVEELVPQTVEWKESVIEEGEEATPIAMEYLQNWEKELLPVMVCASTANVPDNWYVDADQKKTTGDTVLINVLSLPLLELLVARFGSRFFSSSVSQEKVSVEVFVNRCLNDYGLLSPVSQLASHILSVSPAIVQQKRSEVRAEMQYVCTWLQLNVEEVLKVARDPAAAVILAGTHITTSIYNEKKLLSIEGFIKAITCSEQYQLLRKYWKLMSVLKTNTDEENLEIKLFRLIRTNSLKDLVQAFRRSGMYEKTGICYEYLRAIYPVDSGIGEGIVLGEQGKYKAAVEKLLEMEREWMGGKLSPGTETKSIGPVVSAVTQLNLHISLTVIIVMNRLAEYKETAKLSFEAMQQILSAMGDGERDNYQLARYYNVLASYYEWEGEFEKALTVYDKGLKVPEVEESLVSSLLVNVGIIYRMIGKLKSEPKEAIHYLERGVHYNSEGAHAKEVIGNEDQLPIALHNLAETCIELGCRLKAVEKKIDIFQEAYRHSQMGLDINHRINSTKKRGQLLCERFLAVYLLEKANTEVFADKKEVWQQLFDWVEKKSGTKSYDVEVVLELMQHAGDFTGSSLEELTDWLGKQRMQN